MHTHATAHHDLAVGDVVTVPASRHTPTLVVIVTHVGRRYFEGVTPDGTPIGPTGIGLVADEAL